MAKATLPKILELGPAIVLPLASLLFVLFIFLLTRVYTTIRYKYTLRHNLSTLSASKTSQTKPTPSPQLPYSVPILGNALDFLSVIPGRFWSSTFKTYPQLLPSGIFTLLLGGQKAHVLFAPAGIHALFRARGPNRDKFNDDIMQGALGLSRDQAENLLRGDHGGDHWINEKYLLKSERASELTGVFKIKFTETLERVKAKGVQEVNLYEWLREEMFEASTRTIYGDRLLGIYGQDLCRDFNEYDSNFMTLFFRMPRFISPRAYSQQRRMIDRIVPWIELMREENTGDVVDPDEPDMPWEPRFGSRVIRAREKFFTKIGLNVRSRASLNLGFMFALDSNAIPTVGWMLMRVLDPNGDATLLPRISKEIETAVSADGDLDINALMGLPLLQSIYHEVLRLYTDTMIGRSLPADLTLPLDAQGKRRVHLRKGDLAVASSWVNHRQAESWEGTGAPPNEFWADRFLRKDPDTGRNTFTMIGQPGAFFPFGGGTSMCPGRVFAKQEILMGFALVLMAFDLEPLGFLDKEGKPTEKFPGLRNTYLGSAVLNPNGDMKIRIQPRS